jgi:ubiquinone/menaquinone biosynthesis C-methylase UbiE
MNRFGCIAIALIVLFVFALSITACSQIRDPDAWEARHNAIQPPGEVMDAIGVEPGWVIAEVGAGRGRYVVHMAERVGDAGKVYANDIDEDALDYLERRCERDGISNVVTILGEVTDPMLPGGALDMVYMINTYHHLEQPVELMRNIAPGLKPGGLLVIIEHDAAKLPDEEEHTTPQDELLKEAWEAGFELVRIDTFLELDNINIFCKRPPGAKQDEGD